MGGLKPAHETVYAPAAFRVVFRARGAAAAARRRPPGAAPRRGEGAALRRASSSSVACSKVTDSGLSPFGTDAFVVQSDFTWKREQPERFVERDRLFGHPGLQRCALRLLCLLPFRRLAKLHVGAVTAIHHVDVHARRGIDAKRAWAFGLDANEIERL